MAKNTILIAIDDPDWSSIIVHTVFNFINKENTRIILLNVLETTRTEEEYFYRNPDKFIAYEARKSKFAYIENFLETHNFEYSFFYEEGDAAENIINTAKNLDVDLVVTGSHNKQIFERIFLGSVAYKVLRLSPCSVMVISSKYHIHNIRKKQFNVLLAVNGSEPSLDAAGGIINLLDVKRAKVNILNVRLPSQEVVPAEAYSYIDMGKVNYEAEKFSNKMLDKAAGLLENKGFLSVEKVSLTGKPAHTIIEFADNNSIDIIVMGSLGRKDLPVLLLGSTTSKVTERSEVPILVIKKKI